MTPLPPDVLARRIVSARTLRGISQSKLGLLLEAEGIGKHDAARMEREDAGAPQLTPSRRFALTRVLEVPEWWWVADDDELATNLNGKSDNEERLADVEMKQAGILTQVQALTTTVSELTADVRALSRERGSRSQGRSRRTTPREGH